MQKPKVLKKKISAEKELVIDVKEKSNGNNRPNFKKIKI